METTKLSRHLRPTPKGVVRWLSQSEQTSERALFEQLILAGEETPLQMADMATTLGMNVKDVARTLFSLNRAESVSVLEHAPDRHAKGWGAQGLAGLSEELARMTRPGQYMVLSTEDGFQLARAGCGAYEGDVIAASQRAGRDASPSGSRFPGQTLLYAGGKGFILTSSSVLDVSHPAWLRLAYRLLSQLNPFVQGVRTC